MNYVWNLQEAPAEKVKRFMQNIGISRILASALINEQISEENTDMVLHRPWTYEKLMDPLAITNIYEGALLLKEYLDKPNGIFYLFADYDTDGITSAAIFCKGLSAISKKACNGRVPEIRYYIPERAEGYGLSVDFANMCVKCAENNPDAEILVVTVDNGVTAKPAIDILQNHPQIRVLVTDHHEPDYDNNLTPDKDCICVDPHLVPGSPGELLAGCGVIFNVLQELENICDLDHAISGYMYYLLGIGTIGDMMWLDKYNLCVVKLGLMQLNMPNTMPWVKLFKEKAGMPYITTKDIAFTISPIINSCGQMGNAKLAFEMLISDDRDKALEIAEQVYKIYLANREETKDKRSRAEIDILENYAPEHPFIMYPMKTDHPGLASKVATHLSKQISAPIILWAETEDNAGDEVVSGSARNDTKLPVFDIMREAVQRNLAESAEGHRYAFGVKLYRSKLPELQEFLDSKVREYGQDIGSTEHTIRVDCVVSTDDINIENMQDIAEFPFAKNLAAPVVMIRGARIRHKKVSSKNPNNVCYTIQSPDATRPIDVWVWNIKPDEYDEEIHTKVDMIGTIERNFMKPNYATLSVIDLRFY